MSTLQWFSREMWGKTEFLAWNWLIFYGVYPCSLTYMVVKMLNETKTWICADHLRCFHYRKKCWVLILSISTGVMLRIYFDDYFHLFVLSLWLIRGHVCICITKCLKHEDNDYPHIFCLFFYLLACITWPCNGHVHCHYPLLSLSNLANPICHAVFTLIICHLCHLLSASS